MHIHSRAKKQVRRITSVFLLKMHANDTNDKLIILFVTSYSLISMTVHSILVATNKSVRRYAPTEHSHEKLIILFNTLSLASSKDEPYS